MMSEEFFEALARRAHPKLKALSDEWGLRFIERERLAKAGDATIEALKEMMVGEPIKARVHHYLSRYLPGQERTEYLIETEHGWHSLFKLEGYHGTDDEEVTVMVFGHD